MRWVVIMLLLFSALLRTYRVDLKSLEADEIFTVAISEPGNTLLDVLSLPLHNSPQAKPALHFLITHLFLRLEDHDFLLRFPALASGVLGVAATYIVGSALFGRKEGLAAAVLLCISPLHLRYSQWARFYAPLLALSLLSLFFLWRAMFQRDLKAWIGFTVATVLNLYTHLFALFVLASESLFSALWWLQELAASRRLRNAAARLSNEVKPPPRGLVSRGCIVGLAASLVIIVVAYAPMIPHIVGSLAGSKGIAGETETPGLELSLSFFKGLLTGWSMGSGVGLVVFLVLFTIGIFASLRNQRAQILLALLWIGVPFAVLFAVPMQHRFYPRYLVFILPMYLLIVGRGLKACDDFTAGLLGRIGGEKRARSWVGLTAGLILLGAASVSPLRGYFGERTSDWRGAAAFLGSTISSGEAVIVRRPEFGIALLHYDERLEHVELGVLRPRDSLPADLQYEQGIWFVGKEGRKNEMSRLEEGIMSANPGPIFKMVFEGYGDHLLPGAGEQMFWDVWVLYVRSGLDNAQLRELYEQALRTVPGYATDYVERALEELAIEEKGFEGAIDVREAAVCVDTRAPEAHYR